MSVIKSWKRKIKNNIYFDGKMRIDSTFVARVFDITYF